MTREEFLATLDQMLDLLGACPERIVCPGCGRVVRCDQNEAGHVDDHRAPPCPMLGDPELSS